MFTVSYSADSLAQVSGVSKYHQQGGFITIADAEAYLLPSIKKNEAWGIMVQLVCYLPPTITDTHLDNCPGQPAHMLRLGLTNVM